MEREVEGRLREKGGENSGVGGVFGGLEGEAGRVRR